jgi:nitric oxide reductase subunit B
VANPTFEVAGARVRERIWRFTLPAWLALICIVTFTVLISAGAAMYKNAPPIPATVVSPQQEIMLTTDLSTQNYELIKRRKIE